MKQPAQEAAHEAPKEPEVVRPQEEQKVEEAAPAPAPDVKQEEAPAPAEKPKPEEKKPQTIRDIIVEHVSILLSI